MLFTGKSSLIKIIKDKIQKEGKISFRDFMEMALYYPSLGYYSSVKDKKWEYGDFFTSSETDRAFGELVAKQFIEIYKKIEQKPFQMVEIGGGKGFLAYDILRFLKENEPEIYHNSEYILIEKSFYHVENQKEILREFGNIKWFEDLIQIRDESISGVIFSNELFDAFPVHLIRNSGGQIQEMYIALEETDEIRIIYEEPSPQIIRYLEDLHLHIPYGMTTEVNLDAENCIRTIGKKLGKGYVITIDYGYPSGELYKPYRSRGTLLCYYKHRSSENYFENIGLQDMTSHVNFSALAHYGNQAGLALTGFTDQAHFLVNLGLMKICSELQKNGDLASYDRFNRLKVLFSPEGMGEKFMVLIQHKNIEHPEIEALKILPYPAERFRLFREES